MCMVLASFFACILFLSLTSTCDGFLLSNGAEGGTRQKRCSAGADWPAGQTSFRLPGDDSVVFFFLNVLGAARTLLKQPTLKAQRGVLLTPN